MTLIKYLPFSLIAHLLIVGLIGLNLQRTQLNDIIIPKKWVLDVKVVLAEREMQLPSAGVQTADDKAAASVAPEQKKEENKPEPSEPNEIKKEDVVDQPVQPPPPQLAKDNKEELKGSGNEQIQMQMRRMHDAFTARVNVQFLIFHTRAFFRNARMSVKAFVMSGIKDTNLDSIDGSSAIVRLEYNEEGKLKNIEVSSESGELKKLLENVSWLAVPLPSSYYLPYKGINIGIAIKNGSPRIGLEAL